MPTHYYGGAPNAFAGGAMFQQDRRARDYQENALRALIQRFGPEAGDPTAWGQVQTIDQSQQMFPHLIAEQKHRAQVRPFEIGRLEHEQALQPHVLGDAERRTDAYDALTGRFGPEAGDPTAEGILSARNQELRGAALNAARWLHTTRSKGGDLGQAYDRIQSVLPHVGIPAEGVAAIREQIISDPEAVDELIAMLSGFGEEGTGRAMSGGVAMRDADGNLRWVMPMGDGTGVELVDSAGRPYTPAAAEQADTRLQQGDRRLSNEELRMRGFDATPGHQYYMDQETGEIYSRVVAGTAEERAAQDRDRRITAEEHAARQAAQEQVQIADLALNSLDNTLAQMDRWGGFQGGENNVSRALRAAQGLPGVRSITDVGRFMEEIQTLKAHVALDRLAAIKATGATLGQITERELTLLENSMGNLSSPSRSPELIRRDLETIRRIMTDARARAERALSGETGGVQGGVSWQDRAEELRSMGTDPQEIVRILRAEGLIAGGGG